MSIKDEVERLRASYGSCPYTHAAAAVRDAVTDLATSFAQVLGEDASQGLRGTVEHIKGLIDQMDGAYEQLGQQVEATVAYHQNGPAI